MNSIHPTYRKWIEAAKSERKSIRKALKRIAQRPPKNIDHMFQQKHSEAFEQVDCLECANCCKTTSPIFRDRDIDRLSTHLGIRPSAFIDRYLEMDGDSDYVLQTSPCVFLESDNTCSVYEYRPKACREYPHTDRKKITQLFRLTAVNTEICPAAYRIVKAVIDEVL